MIYTENVVELVQNDIIRTELVKKTPSHFPLKFEEKPLISGYKISTFRDRRRQTRNEIYYGLNLENIDFVQNGENENFSSTLKFRTLFVDSDFNTVFQDSVISTFYADSTRKTGLAVNQYNKNLDPGEYTIFVEMSNPESNKLGVYTDKIFIDDYSVDTLILSDLQYSFEIREAVRGDKYLKNGLNITPYPFYEVRRTRPLYLYFEIYNLSRNNQGRTNYEITYDVKLLERKESIFKRLFKRDDNLKESISITRSEQGNMMNVFEYTSFDVSSLRVGKYELKVLIHDNVSGKTAEKSDTFIVVKN